MMEAVVGVAAIIFSGLGWAINQLHISKASKEDVETFKRAADEDIKELKADSKEVLRILTDMRVEAAKNECKS